jgi:filamentous hemagglutinin
VYPVENVVLGNAAGKIAADVLSTVLGTGVQSVASAAGNEMTDVANVTSSVSSSGAANASSGTLAALTDAPAATPTASGFLNASKVCGSGCVLTAATPQQQALVQTILTNGDPTGSLTESLIDSIGQSEGYTILSGGKYGANNGFDHIFVSPSGGVTLLIDSKQVTNGTFTLSPDAAGGNMQLSNGWISSVLNNLDPSSPAYKAITQAQASGKLTTAVAGVNKATGQVIAVPVKIN